MSLRAGIMYNNDTFGQYLFINIQFCNKFPQNEGKN
jgi:hypothetical protein